MSRLVERPRIIKAKANFSRPMSAGCCWFFAESCFGHTSTTRRASVAFLAVLAFIPKSRDLQFVHVKADVSVKGRSPQKSLWSAGLYCKGTE